MPQKIFRKYHRQDTSYLTKKEARRKAEEMLKSADGFMLFTAKTVNGQMSFNANAFITQDVGAKMPAFIQQVLDNRRAELEKKAEGGDA